MLTFAIQTHYSAVTLHTIKLQAPSDNLAEVEIGFLMEGGPAESTVVDEYS